MPTETLPMPGPEQQLQQVPPQAIEVNMKPSHAVAVTERPEETPFYALDESTIRDQIAQALAEEAPKVEAPKVLYMTEKEWHNPRKEYEAATADDDETAKQDAINKAYVMAHAEHPYMVAGKAKLDEALGFFEPIGGRVRDILRHPRKTLKVMKASAAMAFLQVQAENAAQIVGEKYDAMVAAALPFVPKIELPEVLRRESEPAASTAAETELAKQDEQKHGLAAEQLISQLKLDQQLNEQIAILAQADIVRTLEVGGERKLGFVGADGEQHLAPTQAQLKEVVAANADLVKQKAGQGFTRLLAVPAEAGDEAMGEVMRRQVLQHYRSNDLRDSQGKPMKLNKYFKTHDSLQSDDLVQPMQVVDAESADGTLHEAKQRREAKIPGWKLVLVRNAPELPRKAQDLVFMGGRPEFLPGAKIQSYIDMLDNDPRLRGESGFTISMWYSYALTELQRNGQLIDTEGGTFLLGSKAPGQIYRNRYNVPWIAWSRTVVSAPESVRLRMGAAPARTHDFARQFGVRTAVELS